MVAITKILYLATATVAAVVRRYAATIQSDLQKINSDTLALTQAVNNYNGGIANAGPIVSAENTLEKDIKSTTQDAQNSAPVSETDGQNILNYIKNTLTPNLEGSLSAIEVKKSKFDADGLSPTVESDLKQLKSETDDLGAALLAKAPADLQSQGKSVLARIDRDFQGAINYFA